MEQLPESDDSLLETALLASREAGDLIAREYGTLGQFRLKADSSIVTETDVAVEQLVKRLIRERHPEHGFLGEEGGQTASSSGFMWVVDPIDGTKNFLRGVPLFSVEIALVKDGAPHLGVSNLPVMHEMKWAVRGRGAFCSDGPLSVSKVLRLQDAYVSFGNLKHFRRAGRLQGLLGLGEGVFQSRGIGDAWSFHLLAQGRLDVFIDAHTAFWDIAALTVIVQEAGGEVTDIEGRPIDPRSSSVIATNRHLHPLVLESFRT
jgi:histidinol-phosphatase